MTSEYIAQIVNKCDHYLRPEEARILYQTATDIGAKRLLEIGGGAACSSAILATVAMENNGLLLTVEISPRSDWKANLADLGLAEYAKLVEAESPWVNIDARMVSLDYLFVDGNGRMRWVLADYHFFSKFVRVGGRIAFHDWCGGRHSPDGVKRAVGAILETDDLKEVAISEAEKQGLIVFEKMSDRLDLPDENGVYAARPVRAVGSWLGN